MQDTTTRTENQTRGRGGLRSVGMRALIVLMAAGLLSAVLMAVSLAQDAGQKRAKSKTSGSAASAEHDGHDHDDGEHGQKGDHDDEDKDKDKHAKHDDDDKDDDDGDEHAKHDDDKDDDADEHAEHDDDDDAEQKHDDKDGDKDEHAEHGHEDKDEDKDAHDGDEHAKHDDDAGEDGDHAEHEDGDKDEQAGHEGHAHGQEEGGGLTLSPEERRNAGIVIAKAAPGRLRTETRLPGEIVVNGDRVVHLVPRASGVVSAVMKTVGDRVAAGEELATLASREAGEGRLALLGARVQAEVAAAQTKLVSSEVELTRTRCSIAATNGEWQQTVHDNTAQFLQRLREGASLDAVITEFQGKPIGENRARLLGGYVALGYTKGEYEREADLRNKNISSEADFLLAQKEYGSARAEFEASLDDIAFQNRMALLEKQQELQEAQQQLKVAEQQLESTRMEAQAARLGERTAYGSLRIMGLTEADIEELTRQEDGLSSISVRAPIDGVVTDRHIALGELVGDESDVFTIADLSTVWAELTVYLRDLDAVQVGAEVAIRAEHPDRETLGRISMLSPTVDAHTRTATARVVIDNHDGNWRPGVFVVGSISLSAEQVPVVVPKRAVQTIEGENVVFVPAGDVFEPVPVRTGRSDRTNVEIAAGLAPGTPYVAAGSFELKAKLVTSNLDPHAGHGH